MLGEDEVLGVDEGLALEGSCCWDLEGKVCMITKGWGVGEMGIGLGSCLGGNSFGQQCSAGGRGVEAANGGGSVRACIKILSSICF